MPLTSPANTERNARVRIRLKRTLRRAGLTLIRAPFAPAAASVVTFLSPARGQLLRGQILEIRNRSQDHTDAWRDIALRFPCQPEFLRRLAHAALRAGRINEASEAISLLAERGQMRADDAKFIIGLSYVDHARDEFSSLRARLRWFLTALRHKRDFGLAKLRLSRVLLAYFPQRSRAKSRAFPHILAQADISPASRVLLERVYTCERQLMALAPDSLLDTDISADQGAKFVALVRTRLKNREPFSFVRVGDGEAACFPYEPRLAGLARGDRRAREAIWWGQPLPAGLSASLKQKVCESIWQADAIGLPTLGRYLREISLTRDDALENGLTGRGLRAILHAAEHHSDFRPSTLAPPVFTSCHIHQDLQRWNLYGDLLDGAGKIVLISCHPGLPDWMTRKFNVSVAANILLPPDQVSAPKLKSAAPIGKPLPFIMEEIAERMGDWPRGRLVLVGGGYPGKWLVQEATRRGGVALDLGSIFDYWLGLATRSYLDLSPV